MALARLLLGSVVTSTLTDLAFMASITIIDVKLVIIISQVSSNSLNNPLASTIDFTIINFAWFGVAFDIVIALDFVVINKFTSTMVVILELIMAVLASTTITAKAEQMASVIAMIVLLSTITTDRPY